MDEGEKEDIGRLLLPREELWVPLSVAVKAVLVIIGQQDVEAEHFARPSRVAPFLHLQPRVSVLLTSVLVGTHSWAVRVPVTMAVVVVVVMGVRVGAATVGVGVAVFTRVSVSRFSSAMVGSVTVTRAFMVLPIYHNALKLRPGVLILE